MVTTLSSWLMIMSHSSICSTLLCFQPIQHAKYVVKGKRCGHRTNLPCNVLSSCSPERHGTSFMLRVSNVDHPVSSFQKIRTVLQLQGSSLHSGLANFAWHWSNQCMIFNFIFMARSDKKDDSMSYKSVLRSCNKLLCRNSAGHLPINEHLRWWSYATLKMENILSASGVS